MARSRLSAPTALAILGALLASACASSVEWRYYAPLRVMGKQNTVTPVDPGEIHFAGVTPKLHYVSLVLDGIFFRNLPRTLNREVALGVRIEGALPDREIKTVSEPVSARGSDGHLFFERPLVIDPFLYTGRPLRLTITMRDVEPKEGINLRGRLQSLGLLGLASKIAPVVGPKLEQHASQFEAFLGASYKGQLYTYTFSLYPSDMENVRPELVVTGGRHVYVAIPAKGAPPGIKRNTPESLAYKLRMRGRRLEWRHDSSEYVDSPYILLSVIRYKRYPYPDTELRRAAAKVDRLIEEGRFGLAHGELPNIGTALLRDKTITQLERNLETTWRDVREARIEGGLALRKGDKARAFEMKLKEVRLLGSIGRDFPAILEPAEVKDIIFQAKRTSRHADELAAQLGRPEAEVTALRETREKALASIKPPPEPPLNPSLTLKAPEVVTVKTEVPTPFYKQWWFYTSVVTSALAVVGLTTYAVTRPGPLPQGATAPFGLGVR